MEDFQTRSNGSYSVSRIKDYVKGLPLGHSLLRHVYDKSTLSLVKEVATRIYNREIDCYVNLEPNSQNIRSALNVISLIQKALISSVLELAKDYIENPYIYQSRINFKKDIKANGWSWHSDFETWNSQDGLATPECITIMLPLDDNRADNGPLIVLPKSHRDFLSCPKVTGFSVEDHFSDQKEGVVSNKVVSKLKELVSSEEEIVLADVGDVFIFNSNLLHRSLPSENGSRTNLFLVISSKGNQPEKSKRKRPLEMAMTVEEFELEME
tara:strand:+ start:2664 stop:3467 length:804 start_codon:yes stop_codon:yes gene_type:complete